MFQSAGRILVFTLAGITLIIIGYFYVLPYFHDHSTLPKVQAALTWIEDYYTTNARYPTNTEFNNQFPNFNKIGKKSGYDGDYGSTTPQSYSLWYNLSKQNSNAPGDPVTEELGYEGYYMAWPCPRWTTLLNISQSDIAANINSILINNPNGAIFPDFNAGEVYFKHFEGSQYANERISLLQHLTQPRIFWIPQTNKIVVTDAQDVYSYDWDESNLKLLHPQKIGTVPQGCLQKTYHSPR